MCQIFTPIPHRTFSDAQKAIFKGVQFSWKFVGPIKDHSLQKITICRGMRVFVNVYGIY